MSKFFNRHQLWIAVAVAVVGLFGILLMGAAAQASGSPQAADTSPTTSGAGRLRAPVCPSATFDPLQASNSELKQYGIPPRPSDPTALARWRSTVGQAGKCIVGPITQKADVRFPTENSANWSGYKASANAYTSFDEITMEFTVPSFSGCKSGDYADSAVWPGLTTPSDPLVQAGTDLLTYGSGSTCEYQYEAWAEVLPADPYILDSSSYPVASGDTMFVDITLNTPTDGIANFYIANLTQSWWTSPGITTNGTDRASLGQWILERGCEGNNDELFYLSDYGTSVDVSDATAGSNGEAYWPVGDLTDIYQITMAHSGTTYSSPSSLGTGGDNFSFTWNDWGTRISCPS